MRRRARPLITVLATSLALCAGSAVAAPLATAATRTAPAPICRSTLRPRLAARMSRQLQTALAGRDSRIGLTVADPRLGLACALHRTWHFESASVIKVTIISALLYKVHRPARLTTAQRQLAWRMITESDNDAASALWDEVGDAGMQRFVGAAHMRHTVLDDEAWGLSELTAQDELTLLTLLSTHGTVLIDASRRYVLWLMSKVVAGQRWGTPAGAPADVTVSVKNGWLPDPHTGRWHINSLGVFRSLGQYSSRNIRYQIAVLTDGNPSESYGIATIEAAARVIHRVIAHA